MLSYDSLKFTFEEHFRLDSRTQKLVFFVPQHVDTPMKTFGDSILLSWKFTMSTASNVLNPFGFRSLLALVSAFRRAYLVFMASPFWHHICDWYSFACCERILQLFACFRNSAQQFCERITHMHFGGFSMPFNQNMFSIRRYSSSLWSSCKQLEVNCMILVRGWLLCPNSDWIRRIHHVKRGWKVLTNKSTSGLKVFLEKWH